MRFLHLVLLSTYPDVYMEMRDVSMPWYARYDFVTTVYYYYNATLTTPVYHAKAMLLGLPGIESFVPGILQKTLDTLAYFQDATFDYVVRSNVSSLVNFDQLLNFLKARPIAFGGCHVLNQQWLDMPFGIKDETLFGLRYPAGICIILRRDMVDLLLAQRHQVDMTLIDDVAIGVFFRQQNIWPITVGYRHIVRENNLFDSQAMVHRIKSWNRNQDVAHMRQIIKGFAITRQLTLN